MIVNHIFENTNIYTQFLMVPECYNKLMKEKLRYCRDIYKRLETNETLTETQKKVMQEERDEIHRLHDEVCETITKISDRLDSNYSSLSPELYEKYKVRYFMVKSTCLKVYFFI